MHARCTALQAEVSEYALGAARMTDAYHGFAQSLAALETAGASPSQDPRAAKADEVATARAAGLAEITLEDALLQWRAFKPLYRTLLQQDQDQDPTLTASRAALQSIPAAYDVLNAKAKDYIHDRERGSRGPAPAALERASRALQASLAALSAIAIRQDLLNHEKLRSDLAMSSLRGTVIIAALTLSTLLTLLVLVLKQRGDADRKVLAMEQRERSLDAMREAIEAQIRAASVRQAAQDDRDRFIRSIIHELRSPLQSILSSGEFLELLNEADPDSEASQAVKRIVVSGEQIASQVEDLGRMSLTGELEVSLAEKDMSVKDLYTYIRQALQSSDAFNKTKKQGVALSFDLEDPDSATIRCDKYRVYQVLLNLFSNAMKYTPQGSIKACMAARRASESKVSLTIAVEDTGIGIPQEEINRVGAWGYRASNAAVIRGFSAASPAGDSPPAPTGDGLGLAIVHEIARKMHGELTLQSRLGSGTKAVATMFLACASPQTAPPP